eukprot:2843115-Alexandrium_andersonii.AAC.1
MGPPRAPGSKSEPALGLLTIPAMTVSTAHSGARGEDRLAGWACWDPRPGWPSVRSVSVPRRL